MILVNLRELSKKSPPLFFDECLDNFDKILEKYYIKKIECIENASIDINKVIGTKHVSYYDTTWGYLLYHLERIDRNLRQLEDNPNYFVCPDSDRNDWVIAELDEKLYIIKGNHRSVILKFLCYYNENLSSELQGITKLDYIIDYEMHNLENEFNKLISNKKLNNLILKVLQQKLPDNTKYDITLENKYTGKILRSNRDKLKEVIDELKNTNFLKRFLGIGLNKYFRKSAFERLLE